MELGCTRMGEGICNVDGERGGLGIGSKGVD